MRKTLNLIAINIAVFLAILLFLNFSVIIIYQGYQLYRQTQEFPPDPKGTLPNYKNINWAATHFNEFKQLPTEYRSYIGWRRQSYSGQTINIDENGIRVTPQHKDIRPDAPEVVFLGGSTMWGSGANDSTTIPAFFAQFAKGEFRSINLSETAYNAFQGYIFLSMQFMEGLRPDVVISYDGVNELNRMKVGARQHGHARDTHIRSLLRGGDSNPQGTYQKDVLSFAHFFFAPLRLFFSRLEVKVLGDVPQDVYDLSPEKVEVVARELLESWRLTKKITESYGSKFIAVLQPNAGVGSPKLDHLELNSNILDAYRYLYKEVRILLHTPEYQELSKNVTILTNAFNNDEYIYIDFCHVSPNGNKIIAQEIYNLVATDSDS